MDIIQRILDTAVDMQQIPAPTGNEAARAEFVRCKFQDEGLSDIKIDKIHNVYARLPGDPLKRPLVVSAHLDTVFPVDTDLSISRTSERINGPGIGDNSLGVAGLIGLLWLLRQQKIQLPGDLWLVATVGEEGTGDLIGMRRVVDRFGEQPICYVVIEGMAYGRIYHCALASQRYRITASGLGGHSWVDHGRESAIHELGKLITRLVATKLPQQPRTTLNVGRIGGGTSVNTIASQAWLELDLRCECEKQLQKLAQGIEDLVRQQKPKTVRFNLQMIGKRPSGGISEQHPLVQLALRSLQQRGNQAELNIGSTDANIPLSRGFPAICIGLTKGGAAHTLDEYIFTNRLPDGMDHLLEVVRGAYQIDIDKKG